MMGGEVVVVITNGRLDLDDENGFFTRNSMAGVANRCWGNNWGVSSWQTGSGNVKMQGKIEWYVS